MHNKSFNADKQAAIVGGRNIANEYFGAGSGALFADLDVLAIGPVVESEFLKNLLAGDLEFVWSPVSMVSDDPAKVLGENPEKGLMSRQLAEAMGDPKHSITLVSPYFIPTKAGVEMFRKLLLKTGVQLFELRKVPGEEPVERSLQDNLMGSSSSSLHAKTFAVDGKRLFVGSFNFDPRSVHINTELGFVIESPELTQLMENHFEEQAQITAYEVVLDEDGDLQWIERNGDEEIRRSSDPGVGVLKRIMVSVFSFLPIEHLL
ncbi:putative cardiolipin synthase YwiE [Marinobacter litoralis]|uniref:Putative cardiolipin synthase YwiE n=1 Tax=Marinobacter litoralis TaxID=187981 RepID=A0A3M2RC57_9GAMM|nr:phospholipase D-like domain-containing protein [Marinobacter litoralis]RMJ02883.1 putative cardiolipin synthase YwiE [Marinobacter litoralis]